MKKHSLLFSFTPMFLAASLFVFPFSCFSGKDAGVFKSGDRGESWQQKSVVSKKQNIAGTDILSVVIDPKDSQIVYVGSRGAGLYKTVDGGESWYLLEDANQTLNKRANVYDVAIDSRNNGNIYLGTYQDRLGRVFRSSDAGRSWEEVYRVAREKYAVFAVEVDSYDPSVVYIGTAEGGLLKSSDYGKNWKIINWFDDVITDIKVNPHDTRTVFVSTYEGAIYSTNDKGQNWQKLEIQNNFPEMKNMRALVMDKKNPNILYCGSESGLLKSIDGGRNWQKVNIVIPPDSLPVSAIALDPLTSSSLYYSAGNVIYRTQDDGQTWSVHPLASGRTVKVISIDPQNPQILYAGMHKAE